MPSGPTTTAAAAWSWVEKMLQEAQRTSAPSATRVSISTAVWMVMCSEPAIRAPASGLDVAVALAHGHQAGHLVLGEGDLGAPEVGKGQVGDLVVHACSFAGVEGFVARAAGWRGTAVRASGHGLVRNGAAQ